MNKLSAEKRKQMLYVALGTLAVLAVLWIFAVGNEIDASYALADKIDQAKDKLYQDELWLKKAKAVQSDFESGRLKLGTLETGMAPTIKLDWRHWLFTQLSTVLTNYHDQIALGEIAAEAGESCAELLPKFPYSAVRFKVPMTAYYQDFGRFVADLENRFPYMRVENLVLKPLMSPINLTGGTLGANPATLEGSSDSARVEKQEKLSIQMSIVALVKSTSPP